MYRLDGIVDRIDFNAVECDNALNKYKEAKEEFQEKTFIKLFREFDQKETQQKIQRFINNPLVIDELCIIFKIIDKNIEKERQRQESGVAAHLLAILLRNLEQSQELWKKIILILGNPQNTEIVDGFNLLLKRPPVISVLTNIIEEYLMSLCQIGDEFFVDIETIVGEKKMKLYRSIELPHMILIIHHLLVLPETSHQFAKKIFNTFKLSPAFIIFLKVSLRNLSL